MFTSAGLCIPAKIYRQVFEQMDATSFPPHGKLFVTLGFINFLHPFMVDRYSNGNAWFSDNPNVALKMADISTFNCTSDHSDENEIFPIRPASASLVLVSPLGMENIEFDDEGKHTTSLVYVLYGLRLINPDLAPLC